MISAVIMLFLPDGSESSKYVKLLASLSVLCAIAAPLGSFSLGNGAEGIFDQLLEGVGDDHGAEEKYYGVLVGIGSEELEKKLCELVCDKFLIEKENIKIDVEASEKEGVFCVDRVTVGLSGAAVFKDPYDIEEYIGSLVGCDCDTYY